MKLENIVTIIPFTTDLKEPIKTLNIEWLKKYFEVEEHDEKVLSNPQEEIVDKGGMIFYAQYNGKIVGTVSLLKVNEGIYELSKMAVTDTAQGLGIGQKMLQHCIEIAKVKRIQKIILYSNKGLKVAIYLYKKFGFEEVFLQGGIYERANIKM